MDFFEKYTIQVEDWPPNSPVLNLIEHVWVELSGRLHRKYPDIANTPGGCDKLKANLAEVLPAIRKAIVKTYFEIS
jgi:transposase